MMDRRALIAGAVSLLAAPVAAGAQQAGALPRVGLLELGSLAARASLWEAFRQGMRELGYVEGRTVIFEPRHADGKPERLAALAAELVRLKVDVVVTSGGGTLAARQATATIPIVSASIAPLGPPLVASLARPGGNVTGLTTLTTELSAKRVDVARELMPEASLFAILSVAEQGGQSVGTSSALLRETEAAARTLGVRLHAVSVRDPVDLDGAFGAIARERPAVLLVASNIVFFGERRRLAELALKHRLPTVHGLREYVEAGGLIAYGTKLPELFRRAAVYVDKILKGARPGDLPIEQPTEFELVVNQTTAKKLGLAIPPSILLRAEIVQ